ncbi:cupin domain-containing protein [Salinibacterium sp. G-O1]|uniref:cupin domain-containing protein n=1 Tax=Salinibacterium sp. G-O1 TaxID=3046208 RepID=UPI0024B968DD|nr:cupin domain-containing protein [Salinibacterium sp. G-O1]MDJ0336115.1 cupin domain-containing protein [Salinibacterium sp. G-O1]
MTTTSLIRNADEAERRWFSGGGLHTWLVREDEVNKGFLMFEDEVEPGKPTPLHTHPEAEETFYLLAGSILLHVDGAESELRAGGVAVIPRNTPHAFLAGPNGARMLCLHTPGGGENFYRMASEPALDGQPAAPVDFDRIRQAAIASGTMRLVGPPPFLSAEVRS